MNKEQVIQETELFVKEKLEKDSSGHDWYHIHRVRQMALRLAREEGADMFICEITALLHDVADEKLVKSEEQGLKQMNEWLSNHGIKEDEREHILSIIRNMSFKGGNGKVLPTLEGRIVQDADRLDAIGAIGIARTFAYGGAKGDLMYDPNLLPRTVMTKEEYRKGKSTSVNHFYEKLLKLKDLMNTNTAKEIAIERHQVMESFLEQFFEEWNA
ncbi:MAG: HD domain-containing protein [Bacillaceae bacterium]